MRDRMLPIRRDKTDPVSDFWHTIRWGVVISCVIWVGMAAVAH